MYVETRDLVVMLNVKSMDQMLLSRANFGTMKLY